MASDKAGNPTRRQTVDLAMHQHPTVIDLNGTVSMTHCAGMCGLLVLYLFRFLWLINRGVPRSPLNAGGSEHGGGGQAQHQGRDVGAAGAMG